MAYNAAPMRIEVHREEVQKIWAESMTDERIRAVVPARIRWFYEDNPVGPAHTWLGVHVESDEIVGCASFFPRVTYVRGKELRTGVLSDFAVAKAHRSAGAAVAMQRALAKSSAAAGFAFLYGYPNQASALVCKRVGYQTLGETANWVKPLRSEYKVRQRVSHPAVVKALSLAIDLGLAAADRARCLGRTGRFEGEVTRTADASFDELWHRVKGRYSIVGERTAAYLNWRYAAFKTEDHFFYRMRDERTGRLAGYVIYTVQGDKVFIKDLFCEDLGATAKTLLLMAARRLRRDGFASVSLSYLGPAAFEDGVRGSGFFRRPGKRPLVVYLPPGADADLAADVARADNWFMVDGELDI